MPDVLTVMSVVLALLILLLFLRTGITQRVVQRGNRVAGMSSSTISMNGKSFKISNGRVFVNDVEYGPIGDPGVSAPVDNSTRLKLDRDGTVKGPITGDLIVEGSVPVTLVIEGAVGGLVQANGNVTCGDVGGTIQADRDVTCGTVQGTVMSHNVKITGDIHGTCMADKVTQAR